MMQEVHVELLLGMHVLDAAGESVGHIEEICAEEKGGELLVEEFHTGMRALGERLSATGLIRKLVHVVRRSAVEGFIIAWDELDLSDPKNPRTVCLKRELREKDF